MRLFHFYRIEDHSGVSGTGPVVEGVEFTNGWCAIRWLSNKSSMCFYQSIEDVKAIHGHGGKTEIVVHDFLPLDQKLGRESSKHFEIFLRIIEETSKVVNLSDVVNDSPDPEHQVQGTREEVHGTISLIKRLLDRLESEIDHDLKRAA